jgi:hypothetical protein
MVQCLGDALQVALAAPVVDLGIASIGVQANIVFAVVVVNPSRLGGLASSSVSRPAARIATDVVTARRSMGSGVDFRGGKFDLDCTVCLLRDARVLAGRARLKN